MFKEISCLKRFDADHIFPVGVFLDYSMFFGKKKEILISVSQILKAFCMYTYPFCVTSTALHF